MGNHRADRKRGRIISSTQLTEHPDAYIELIEEYPCDTKEQLNRREGEIIRATPTAVNRQIAGRTEKEKAHDYYMAHKEAVDEKNRLWQINNREKRAEHTRAYRERKKLQSQKKSEQTIEQNGEDVLGSSRESLPRKEGDTLLNAEERQ
jgi:hypothetical protein